MKLQKDQKYIEKKYAFPSENIPQSLKNGPEYFLNCANAILWKFIHNKTAIPYEWGNSQDSIAILRSYMNGNNSPDKYKDRLCGLPTSKGTRSTTMNISWRVPQILPEKMDVVKGYIMKLAYDITTQAIDMQAKMDKDLMVANMKLMVDDKMKLIGVSINESAGREVVQQDTEAVPFQNEQQVEMFANIGGVILEQEASIKILLDETLLHSDWQGIRDKLVEDILACAICATKVYNDAGSDIAKARYVDIERAIIPYSTYNDYRDITFGGEIRQMTIAELRSECDLSEKEILEIARMYSRDEKSPQYMGDFFYQAQQGYNSGGFGMNMIDSLVLDIADLNWVGTHTDTLKKYNKSKSGNRVIEKKTDDYEPSDYSVKSGVEVEKSTRQCVYKVKIVVGTDHVFDYGKEYNQTYKKDDTGKQVVIFPYRFTRTGSSSLVTRAIGFVDDLALATYKKRNALKKILPPPGLYLEQSAFENTEIGGNKLGPKAAMKLGQDTGFLIGNTQNLWGSNTVGRQPLTIIPSTANDQINLFNNEILFNVQQIELVTGINDIFSGASPQSETGLGVSKIAINATMNAIYPVVNCLETSEEQMLRVAAKKWQVASLTMDEPGRKSMPHDRALSYIKIGARTSFDDFMIKLQVGATDDEKLMLMQDIRALQDVRRQAGVGGIRPSDYLMIFEMIKNGNIKQARLVLAQVEEYIQNLDDKKAQENQQFNIDSQMQSNQQTAENELEITSTEEQLIGQREAQNIQLKIQGDLMLQKQKAQDERQTLAMSNVYGWGSENYNKKVKQ